MSYPTWSDPSDESIVPVLGARTAPGMETTAVMVSCAPDLKHIRANLTDPKIAPFFNSTLITPKGRDGGICITGPYIGSPYAAMLLESLIAKGVKKVVVLGWCGAIDDSAAIGDLIIPHTAFCDEGTSGNYARLNEKRPVVWPDKTLTEDFESFLEGRQIKFCRRSVWTTDAVYRETPKKVSHFSDMGASVVEMECSALFAVAAYRKIAVSALLVVSDIVGKKEWMPGFRSGRFKQARLKACDAVIEFSKISGLQ